MLRGSLLETLRLRSGHRHTELDRCDQRSAISGGEKKKDRSEQYYKNSNICATTPTAVGRLYRISILRPKSAYFTYRPSFYSHICLIFYIK